MPQITFNVNNKPVSIDAENDDELLYLLRDRLGITGPKYGCGVGVCGACTIFKDGELARPCIVPMEEVVHQIHLLIGNFLPSFTTVMSILQSIADIIVVRITLLNRTEKCV